MNTRRISAFLLCGGLAIAAGCMSNSVPTVGPPNDNWFRSEVVSQDKPVLVDFGAEWCPPCKALKPHVEKLGATHGDKLKVVTIDVDERQDLAAHYGVEGIPRLMIFKEGQIVAAETGGMDYESLESWALSNVK